MAVTVSGLGVPVVLMHNSSAGGYRDPIGEVGVSPARKRPTGALGRHRSRAHHPRSRHRTWENAWENVKITRRLPELGTLGFPLLIGPSHKSFIGKTLDLPVDERLEGTAAAVALSIAGGADIVRVHDVKVMVRVARMADAIVRS